VPIRREVGAAPRPHKFTPASVVVFGCGVGLEYIQVGQPYAERKRSLPPSDVTTQVAKWRVSLGPRTRCWVRSRHPSGNPRSLTVGRSRLGAFEAGPSAVCRNWALESHSPGRGGGTLIWRVSPMGAQRICPVRSPFRQGKGEYSKGSYYGNSTPSGAIFRCCSMYSAGRQAC
jgi:hypothetical protein